MPFSILSADGKWHKRFKYPPSTPDQVISWWGEESGSTYFGRDDLLKIHAFVESANKDITRPTQCKASVLDNSGTECRCTSPTAGVRFCNGEHFCKKHL